MKYVRSGWAVVMGMVAVGCASTPAPTAKLASSEAALRSATEVGAADVPQAGTYLQLAQKQFDQGKTMMRKGDNHDAAGALAMSQADSEVAIALTKEGQTRAAAEQTKAQAAALRSGAPGSAVGGGPTQPAPAHPMPPPSNTPSTKPGQQPGQQPAPAKPPTQAPPAPPETEPSPH